MPGPLSRIPHLLLLRSRATSSLLPGTFLCSCQSDRIRSKSDATKLCSHWPTCFLSEFSFPYLTPRQPSSASAPTKVVVLPVNHLQITSKSTPNCIQIISKSHQNRIQIESKSHPNHIQINPTLHPNHIQIISKSHPNHGMSISPFLRHADSALPASFRPGFARTEPTRSWLPWRHVEGDARVRARSFSFSICPVPSTRFFRHIQPPPHPITTTTSIGLRSCTLSPNHVHSQAPHCFSSHYCIWLSRESLLKMERAPEARATAPSC